VPLLRHVYEFSTDVFCEAGSSSEHHFVLSIPTDNFDIHLTPRILHYSVVAVLSTGRALR